MAGLIPAAGSALRLGRPSGSKELLRVWRRPGAGQSEPEPAIRCLLSALKAAAIERTVIVHRPGKEDIPAALGSETDGGMRLEYVCVEPTPAPPFTVRAAAPRLAGATVVLGFPDILFAPPEAAARLLDRLDAGAADVVLGLFPHPVTRRADVVELDTAGTVARVDRSRQGGPGSRTWGLAAWRPSFTDYLVGHVDRLDVDDPRMTSLGVADVINAAIEDGLEVLGETVSDEPFLDVGTPEALEEAYRRLETS